MKTIYHFLVLALASLSITAASLQAAAPPALAGHWEGAIALPNLKIEIRVDLASSGDAGTWSGTIDIPAQGLAGFKLTGVSAEGSRVSFKMPGIPGDPVFEGSLSSDRSQLTGDFRQGGKTFPFALEHRAASVAAVPAPGVPGTGLAGHWRGSLPVAPGVSLRLVLHVVADAAGALTATLDSVDQNVKDIPVSSVTFADAVARLDVTAISAHFEGRLSASGTEIEGRWKQGLGDLPLVFRRLASNVELSRPQEPKKPYSYQEHSVFFPGGATGVTLAGTLTVPPGTGPFPAVVLISGSGPHDRDAAMLGHKPFLFLADYRARHGIAVLRYDDRGVAGSTGNYATATHEAFAADAGAAFKFLKSQPGVDPAHAGLCGHSEGGLQAVIVAAGERNVAFTVMLAAIGVPLEQLLLRQRQDFLRVTGIERLANPNGRMLNEKIFAAVRKHGGTDETRTEIRAILHQIADYYPPEQREAMGFSDSAIDGQVATMTSPWFVTLLAYDPAPMMARVHCPVLALNGEKDIQVACRENLDSIRDGLAAGGNTSLTLRTLPGLNHLFQHCTTGTVSEYGTIEETMSPEVLTLVSDWILQNARR